LQLYWKILHNPNIILQIIDKIILLIYIAKLAKIVNLICHLWRSKYSILERSYMNINKEKLF
jgi:hypothetical protein